MRITPEVIVFAILFALLVVFFLIVNKRLSRISIGSAIFQNRLNGISETINYRNQEIKETIDEIKTILDTNIAAFDELKELVERLKNTDKRKFEECENFIKVYEERDKLI